MNLKLIICLATVPLAAGKIQANEQSGSCAVYFSVLQNDEPSAQRSTLKMNQAQSSWYEKYGNREKYAGICYVESGASAPVDEPLYVILWGEHAASEPYAYSYEATAPAKGDGNATGTGQKGGTSSSSGTTSDSRLDTKHDVADGWLAVWTIQTGDGKGSFVPIGPVHGRRHMDASTSLLEDAMEQIAKREKERLAARTKGWAVVTFRPIYSQQSTASENPPATSQSADTVPPAAASPTQTAAPDPPPAKSSVATSAVSVSSGQPGAEIYVDDNFVGNTPSTITVTAGKHVITVKKSGYQDWVRAVNFSGGLITLDAELAEANEPSPADTATTADLSKEPRVDPASIRSTQKPVGWIGISTKSARQGALVTEVSAHGPAALAGLHVGDVILALDGRRIKSDELQTVVAAFKPGTRVPVRYARASSAHEVWITVASETQEH